MDLQQQQEAPDKSTPQASLRRTALIAGAGAAIAIGVMEACSSFIHTPLAAIPFATSIVLVVGSPDAIPAQPKALIGGHLIATLVGFFVLALAGPSAWAGAVAVGLAVVAMIVTDTFHPPAGIDPLLVVTLNLPWSFIVVPVLAGALLLGLFALVWHRFAGQVEWPRRRL